MDGAGLRSIVKNVDKGFYPAAKAAGKSGLQVLAEQVNPEAPEIEKRAAELGASYRRPYAPGTPWGDALEKQAVQRLALEKLLGACGVKRSDTVEKAFFSSTNASTIPQGLFPAFLAQQIIAGQMAVGLVSILCMADVRIGSHIQEKVKLSDTTATRQLAHVDEGTDLPKTTISQTNGSITLHKYGRMIEATYESVRLMTLDILGLQLQRMGRQIGIDETDDLLETAVNGDGNTSSSGTSANTATSGTLAYTDLVTHWQSFAIGYQQRHTVAPDALIANLVNMAEFKDRLQGFTFLETGMIPGPLGATWHRWTSTGSAGYGTKKMVSFDDRVSVICYREGDLMEEADQLIDKQIHRRTMSEWVGFATWDTAGINILDRQS